MATIRFNVGAAARPFLEAVRAEQRNAAEAGYGNVGALRDLAHEIDRALLRDVGKTGDAPDGFAVQVGVHDLCAAWRVLEKSEEEARYDGFEDGMDRAAFAAKRQGDEWLIDCTVLPGEVAPEPDVGELVEAALDEAIGLIRDAVPAWDSASDDFASRFFDGANGETIMVILREYAQGMVAKGGGG